MAGAIVKKPLTMPSPTPMPSPLPADSGYDADDEQTGGAPRYPNELPATGDQIVIINGLVIQLQSFTDDTLLRSYLRGLTDDELNVLVQKPSTYDRRVREGILDRIRDEWIRRYHPSRLQCAKSICASKVKSMMRRRK